MPAEDSLTLRMRALGAQATAQSVRGVTGAVTGLDRASKRADKTMGRLATGLSVFAGIGVASAFKQMASAGWNYNQMLDRQRVGFTTYMGSQKEALKFMQKIQALALRSPILDPQSTGEAARRLMSYGVAIKDTLPFVEALGDMAAASGKSMQEVMPLGAKAIGQIASKDKLQAEELNQLAESVGLSRGNIRKALKMTREDFEATFTPGNNLPWAKVKPALLKAMDMQSKGASDRLSKTTEGRIQRFKETFNRALAQITRPIYDEVGKFAGGLATKLQDIWAPNPVAGSGGLLPSNTVAGKTLGDKLAESWATAKPMIQQEIKNLDIGGKIVLAAEWAGRHAPGAFIDAFKAAPAWAQFAGGAWLLSKLGITGKLADMLKGKVGGKGVLGKLSQLGGSPANPMYVTVVGAPLGGPGGPGGKPGGKPGGGRGSRLANKFYASNLARYGLPGVALGALALEGAAIADPGNATLNRRIHKRGAVQPGILGGRAPGAAQRTRRGWGPQQAYRPGGGTGGRPSSPLLPDSAKNPVFHAHLHLDGKELATAIEKQKNKHRSTR